MINFHVYTNNLGFIVISISVLGAFKPVGVKIKVPFPIRFEFRTARDMTNKKSTKRPEHKRVCAFTYAKSVLQCPFIHVYFFLKTRRTSLQRVVVRCGASRCVAVCCGVLQCVAVCCGVLWCVAVRCGVLQRTFTQRDLERRFLGPIFSMIRRMSITFQYMR